MKAVYGPTTVYTPFPDYELTVSGGTETIRTTYRLAGRIVAVRTGTGAINHVAFDHLGSVGALYNSSGVYIGQSLSRFDPFGNFRTKPLGSNPTVTTHGFTGHRHNNTSDDDLGLVDLGLIYMNARYYSPEVGRFISPDTIVSEPGNPQSFNRYAYALNSPVNYTDPTGHMVSSGCEHESCTLPDGYTASTTWRTTDEALVHWDPNLAAAQDYNPITQAVLPGGAMLLGGAFGSVAVEGILGTISLPTLASGGSAACADGNCTNEASGIVKYAQSLQGRGKYPGVDNFTETVVKKGELLVGSAEGQGRTAFYTTIDSLVRSGKSAEALWKGLQVARDRELGYRSAVTIYRAIADVPAAVGQALANSTYGQGGYTQVVIENFREALEPVVSLFLH